MLVTALAPVIGYDKASQIAHYATDHDLTLKQAALKLGFVTEAEFDPRRRSVEDGASLRREGLAQEVGDRTALLLHHHLSTIQCRSVANRAAARPSAMAPTTKQQMAPASTAASTSPWFRSTMVRKA